MRNLASNDLRGKALKIHVLANYSCNLIQLSLKSAKGHIQIHFKMTNTEYN